MTITPEQLDNLRGLIKFSLPLPWKWWTSNSHTRLTSAVGKDGDVIHAFKAVDGHTCVNVSSDNRNLIESAVNALPELLANIEAQAARITELEEICSQSYQVVGALTESLGIFELPQVIKALDNLSKQKLMHKDVLPFTVTPQRRIE